MGVQRLLVQKQRGPEEGTAFDALPTGLKSAPQPVGFGVEGDAVFDHIGVHKQQGGGVGRAGEDDHVLAVQAVQ